MYFMKHIISQKYKRFILILEILMLIILLPIAYNFVPLNGGTKTFYIPSSNEKEVILTLQENGYEVTWIDKMMLKWKQLPAEGWYTLQPENHGRFSFFMHLYKQQTDELMDVIVFAGETKVELTKRLANDMKHDEEILLESYNSLARFKEADIFSGRYTIARQADENTTMGYIFKNSREKLRAFKKEYLSKTSDTMDLKIVHIIASIIQKESNSVKEMPFISSVIYNRLKKGMRLQMDSTLNYDEYAHTIVTPERIRNDKSYYNTYKHKGLPPHPLSSVTLDALKAAIKPIKSDYLFFMLNKKGTHDFTSTYDQHLEKLRAFREYQKERKKQKEEAEKNRVENTEQNATKKKPFGLSFGTSAFK